MTREETLKKRIALFLVCMMVFSLFGTRPAFATSGTATGEVKQITSVENFPDAIAEGETYELTTDITLGTDQQISSLAGVLDGKGHTITLANKPLAETVSGTIQNLGVTSENTIESSDNLGSIAVNLSGTVQNCFSTAKLKLNGWQGEVGGLAGNFAGGTIKNSYFTGTIEAMLSGGIAGTSGNSHAEICNCIFTVGNSAYSMGSNVTVTGSEKKTEEELKSGSVNELLNTNLPDTGFYWTSPASGENNGLPILAEGQPPVGVVDKTVLKNTITTAESKVEADYTKDSWQALEAALSAAKEIFAKIDATQDEVNAAASALQTALDGLEKIKPTEPVEIPDSAIKISTVSDLEKIGTGTGKYYVLENDITIKQSDLYVAFDEFQGVFDGQGHSIIFDRSGGLFGSIGADGVVQNVHFTGTVSGNGPLGQTISGAVLNCYSDTEEANSAGFANKLDGGILVNCYSVSTANNGAIVNLYGEAADGNTYTGTLYNTYWRSGLTMPSIPAEDLKNGSGAKTEAEMKSKAFVTLLNAHRGTYGTSWGLSAETGYPYFGEDQSETLPESKYPIIFQETGKDPVQDKDQALRVFVGSSGSLSLKDASGQAVTWELENASPEGCMTLEGAVLRADQEGSAVLTASMENGQGEREIVAAAAVAAVTRTLESITLSVSGDEDSRYITKTGDGKYTVAGSAYAKINISEKYEGDDTPYTGNVRDYEITSSDASYALSPMASEVQFTQPGTAVMTVTSKKNPAVSASVELTSTYVRATSVKPGISGSRTIHGRNANDWESSPERFNPEYLGVDIQPSNASYRDRAYVAVTSSDKTIGVYHNLAYVPVGAGTVTYTATVKDPRGGEVSGSSTVTYEYQNPLRALSVDGNAFTLKANEEQVLPLTFTGEKDQDGWSITDPVIDWSYSESGIVEINRRQAKAYRKTDDNAPDYLSYVLDTGYVLSGVKEGTVTVTGTPRDKTNKLQPVTFTVTVSGTAELPEVNISETIAKGMEDAAGYIRLKHTNGYTYDNNDWAVQALISAGKAPTQTHLDEYYASVEDAVKKWDEKQKPTDIERVVLALAAMKKDVTDVGGKNLAEMIYNHPDLDSGSNELAWALIALDAAGADVPQDAAWTKAEMIEALLTYKNSDGGFALSKTETDSSVDITAMALQALAPYEGTDTDAKAAIESGLEFLKGKLSGGINPGYGTCEAEAQVILTLAVLKKDVIEAGFGDAYRNLFSHLETNYKNVTGGYKHQANDAASQEMSTIQVLQAYDAYNRFLNGGASYWDFGGNQAVTPGGETTAQDVIAAIGKITDTSKLTLGDEETVKAVRELYNALSDEEKEKVSEDDLAKLAAAEAKIAELRAQTKEITVSFTLLGDRNHNSDEDKIVHNLESGNLETWIEKEEITVREGASVGTVLREALSAHGYSATYTHGGEYVAAITTPDGFTLSEFDNGKNSGWKYNVNGSYPDKALTAYKVSDDDDIIWCYTDNYQASEPEEKPPVTEPEEKPPVTEPEEKPPVTEPEEKPPVTEPEEKPPVSEPEDANAKVIADVKATTIKAESVLNKASVKLTWTKSKGSKVDGYQIYRSTKKSSGYKKYATTKKLAYTNRAGLKKGTRYYYKIRGYRKVGGKTYYTKWSNTVKRTMKADSEDYGVKKATVKARAAAAKGSVKVSWSKAKGCKADGYEVYRSTKKAKNFKKLGTTKKTSYKDKKTLKKGATYYYKVRGYRVLDGKKYYTKWSSALKVKAK